MRGDLPDLYFKGDDLRDFNPVTYWERCGLNKIDEKIDECETARENRVACALYKAYHFSAKAKHKGAVNEEYKVNNDYIELVKNIQIAMRKSIAKQHIVIESNPTSNKLIGAYRQYADHPLKRFFNLGLTHNTEEINASPQLSVSINTDDLGVFATNIENEYALMAISAEKERNANGELKYNSRMVYDWLDKIREMGFEQKFKKE